MEEYSKTCDVYKHQQRKAKILIREERVNDERRQLDELRSKGEEGGKIGTGSCTFNSSYLPNRRDSNSDLPYDE